MLRCPTSELPICPSGRPTSLPDVRKNACGQLAHRRSKLGVRAWRIALSAASSRQPHPSRTTSMTGRRFCIWPRPLHLAGVGEARQSAFIAPSKGCVGSRCHRQPAARLRPIATVLLVSHGGDFYSVARLITQLAVNSTS
jgi:hypothetical protein